MAVSEEKEFAMFGINDGDSMLKERILVSKSYYYYDFMQLLTISKILRKCSKIAANRVVFFNRDMNLQKERRFVAKCCAGKNVNPNTVQGSTKDFRRF